MRGNAPEESGRAAAGKTSWPGCPVCLSKTWTQTEMRIIRCFFTASCFFLLVFGGGALFLTSLGTIEISSVWVSAGLSRNAAQEMKRPGCPARFLGGIRKQDARKMKTGGEKMVFRFWCRSSLCTGDQAASAVRPGKKMTGLPGPFSERRRKRS